MSQRPIVHIVQGDHGAHALREAARLHGLTGSVVAIPEDLSHGPLDDGRTRIDYMRACFEGFGAAWNVTWDDAFAPWRALETALQREPGASVAIWCSGSVQDHVFLRIACWHLAGHSGPLWLVPVPPRGDLHGVGMHDAASLAELALAVRGIDDRERTRLASEFAAIRGRAESVRRLEDGRLLHLQGDAYDTLLLQSCAEVWNGAAQIVARAMQRCDALNRMTDLFFSARLRHLIDAGLVEAEGERSALALYRVRLARS
jgi:hypothetical protein